MKTQKIQRDEAYTCIGDLVDAMRRMLRLNADRFPEITAKMPHVSVHTLYSFARNYDRHKNPTVDFLKRMELACRVLDPDFPAPLYDEDE